MQRDFNAHEANAHKQVDEFQWSNLYARLLPSVEKWVRNSSIPSWRRQYKEVAEDITQEAIVRALDYDRRAARNGTAPIDCLEAFSKRIAHNLFLDQCKKEWRIVHPSQEEMLYNAYTALYMDMDWSKTVLDDMILGSIIVIAAGLLATFPKGQRKALLTDLANAPDFSEQPGPLEQALLDNGLSLRDFRRPLPADRVARSRHTALLCIAKKRLRNELQA